MSRGSAIAKDMFLRLSLPKLSDTKLDELIKWAKSGKPSMTVTQADLIAALLELRLQRRMK
jgi:hypothetical protein